MNLVGVTITGADDGTPIEKLAAISSKYPFVEWGILISSSGEAKPRYPSEAWIQRLAEYPAPLNLAMHIQGKNLHGLCTSSTPSIVIKPYWPWFSRVQLNWHGVETGSGRLYRNLREAGSKQFIFQMDGVNDALFEERTGIFKAVPLFDASHGEGRLPSKWPTAGYVDVVPGYDGGGLEVPVLHGYAGGLGPDNLEVELPRIAAAAGRSKFWIDMESGVRSVDDGLDLDKVEEVMLIAQLMIADANHVGLDAEIGRLRTFIGDHALVHYSGDLFCRHCNAEFDSGKDENGVIVAIGSHRENCEANPNWAKESR